MKKAIAYYYNKRAQSTAKHKTGRKKEKCQMKTSLILAEEKYTCISQTANFFLEKLQESFGKVLVSLLQVYSVPFSVLGTPPLLLRQEYYVMSPKNQNNPLIGMHKLNGGYLHIAVYILNVVALLIRLGTAPVRSPKRNNYLLLCTWVLANLQMLLHSHHCLALSPHNWR